MKRLFKVLLIACLFFVTGISESNAQCNQTSNQASSCSVYDAYGTYQSNYFYWVFNSPTGNLHYDIQAYSDGGQYSWAQAHVWTGISVQLYADPSDRFKRETNNLSGFGSTQDFDGDVQCFRGSADIYIQMW
jgi:hypothetical protein